MRAAAVITTTELRRFSRDRTALIFVLVLPVAVIIVIGSTFAAVPTSLPVGVVVVADDDASAAVLAALDDADTIDVSREDSRRDLDVGIRTGALAGGVVVDAGSITIVIDQASSSASAVRSALTGVLARVQTIDAVVSVTGLPRDSVERVAELVTPIDVERVTVEAERVGVSSPFSYTAPSNLVLFTFINSLTSGAMLVVARRTGITQRWAAAPVRPSSLVAGVLASRLVFALVQALLILVIGSLLFGVVWGDPLAVGVVVLLFSLVATGAGVFLNALARNEDQSSAIAIPVAIALGMLGGCMWPLEVVGDTMRTVGHLTPHAWAMDAFVTLVFDGGGLADIATEVAILGGFAVVILAGSTAVLARRLV